MLHIIKDLQILDIRTRSLLVYYTSSCQTLYPHNTVVSLSQNIPNNNTLIPVTRRTTDNLPSHIKGEVSWANHNTHTNQNHPCTGYYLPQEKTPTQ
jgi:hypothetical protein